MNQKACDVAINRMNLFGSQHHPFLFIIDFEMQKPLVCTIEDLNDFNIRFNINRISNYTEQKKDIKEVKLYKYAVPFEQYKQSFDYVLQNLLFGNSYLTNLTFPTAIQTNLSLSDIFNCSKAKYKLLFGDEFVVFSPEIFVRTHKGRIYSYPMKGTIDAALPNAENEILNNPKETAEHATIVDLIRNDLSMVATDVRVDKYRYIDRLTTHEKTLLQVSSEISGELPTNFHKQLGSLIFALLPAGSISGAPKKKTIEIIKNAELGKRGYYTGVVGYFDGKNIDSGVMIRYIENTNDRNLINTNSTNNEQLNNFVYRSGGGITTQSNPENEYNELIDKVYVPIY